MNKVKYGFLSRGNLHYVFIFQNVLLEAEKDCIIKCSCKNLPELNFNIQAKKGEKYHFICEYDMKEYKQRYKLNKKTLFITDKEPKDLYIEYENFVNCTTTQWSLTDH